MKIKVEFISITTSKTLEKGNFIQCKAFYTYGNINSGDFINPEEVEENENKYEIINPEEKKRLTTI